MFPLRFQSHNFKIINPILVLNVGSMLNMNDSIVNTSGTLLSETFMPHGHCYLWRSEIIWLHVISDGVIVLSYYLIPFLLTYVLYKAKREIPFSWLFLLFAIFIVACGTTHLMEIVNVWKTNYILAGVVKAITAVVSILTAIAMVPILPKVIEVFRMTKKD